MSHESKQRSTMMQSRVVVTSVDVTSTQVLRGDGNRVSITFTSHPTQRVTYSPVTDAVLDAGLNLPAAARPFTMTEDEHGDAVRANWNAITVIGAANFGIIETIILNRK